MSFIKLIKNEYPNGTTKESDNIEKNLIDFSETKSEFFKNQNYETIKRDCLQQGKLFEDPLFPAVNSSISKNAQSGIVWKRPSEFTRWPISPCFIKSDGIASELDPGKLGKNKVTFYFFLFYCQFFFK